LYKLPRLSATLSSTHLPHIAAYCIDDDDRTMCHSEAEPAPWVSVELPADSPGSPAQVSQNIIYNRYECCWERLSPFQLWVGQSTGDFESNTSTPCGLPNLTVPATRGPFGFDCTSVAEVPDPLFLAIM
jgi:hypothetical protein